jgi:hypothetical protein
VVREAAPRIVFPGNLQGRHARETGPKGCELVVVEDGHLRSAEFVALDVVRWHALQLDATGVGDVDGLAGRFRELAGELAAHASDRLHALRVTVAGESTLHQVEAARPGTIAAAIQAAAQDIDAADLWIESVRFALNAPIDRASVASRGDAAAEVVALVDALAADPAAMRDWCLARLDSLGLLPPDLADADPRRLDEAALRTLLADAEATVLALLAGESGGSQA